MLIANEYKRGKDSDRPEQSQQSQPRPTHLDCKRLLQDGHNPELDFTHLSEVSSPKKRKRDGNTHDNLDGSWPNLDDVEFIPPLPSEVILEAIVETYFSKIQPWIPFLHVPTFRIKLRDQRERAKIKVLLHALVSATMKHLKLGHFCIGQEEMRRQVRISRNVVTLHAMGSLSVENLQALIILAFDYVYTTLLLWFAADIIPRWETDIFPKHGQ
jgi:hypothetical protein